MEYDRDGGQIADGSLESFRGPDGLMDLLALAERHPELSAGAFEIIRRIHVPGYELARRHLTEAVTNTVLDPIEARDLGQNRIDLVISWIRRQQEEARGPDAFDDESEEADDSTVDD